MRSKIWIDKINDMEMKLGTKVILRKIGKAKTNQKFRSDIRNGKIELMWRNPTRLQAIQH